jgi:hypothetical protein
MSIKRCPAFLFVTSHARGQVPGLWPGLRRRTNGQKINNLLALQVILMSAKCLTKFWRDAKYPVGDFLEGRKRFFFEKKKQKTFANWAPGFETSTVQISGSFLVLFFKKELLACLPAF